MAAKRPLVNSEPVSEFGAAMPNDAVAGDDPTDVDLLYVPGWSELRRDRDLALAEYRAGTRRGEDVPALPGNLRWVSCTEGTAGKPSSVKLMRSANNGYVPVTKAMIGTDPRITKLPPGAKILPDGTIQNAAGDLQLQYCDAPTARRNQARKARAAQNQIDSVGMNLGEGAEGLGGRRYEGLHSLQKLGLETTVERTTA